MRATPFGYVFGEIASLRFPAIADALARAGATAADRDQFVLLEPVGRLLREIVPVDAGPEALESHVRLLHHAFCHWAAHGFIYRIGDGALKRAVAHTVVTSRLPRSALYLQLPELRVWGSPSTGAAPEPLDGVFVTESLADGLAILGVFGMRPDRPGFSAVALEGRADTDDPSAAEVEVAAARADGSPPFGPLLAGGSTAGLHSLANPGELLLLTCRLLALLPERDTENEKRETTGAFEQVVPVD